MYLKQIKTNGFKSFAESIEIDFQSGTTGIVGPNGSGKSNVVDAVRFVLGEQSVKSLRGTNSMTDFIFSGSKNRKAANVASVTLIFDNADQHLPLSYHEIAVKRRIYRNGENEYFINNERCRLKDITDLFVDSGSAKESFNIISQGSVQEILSHKAEDRRVIFEEAAGVLKYKKRKEEALKKLSRTHQNLDRIQDIISELERHLEPLKKQANDASKYLRAKEDLTSIEVALITLDIEVLNTDYLKKKKQIELLENEIMKIDTTTNQTDANYERLKLEGHKIDSLLNETQKLLIEKTSLVETLNSDKKIILERQKYETEDMKLYDNVTNLKEQEHILENEIVSFQGDLTDLEDTNETYLDKITELEEQYEQVFVEKDKYSKLLSIRMKDKMILGHNIDVLKNSVENYSSLNYGVKGILNNPKLSGICGIIGEVIDVSEDYATAISASLGGAQQFVITETERDAKEAIAFLKQNKLGRVTFFPRTVIQGKWIDPQSKQRLQNEPGFVGIASELIQYPEAMRNIVENQLGNVIVAETIDDANHLSQVIQHRYKIVTLSGELVHVGGSITGGTIKNQKNIINEKYELEKMTKYFDEKEQECQQVEEKMRKLDDVLETITKKQTSLKMQQVTLIEQMNAKKKELSVIQSRKQTIHHEIKGIDSMMGDTIGLEVQKIMDQYYEESQLLEELQKRVEHLKTDKNKINVQIEDIDSVSKKELTSYNHMQKELKDLEIAVTRMDVQLDNLLNALSEDYQISFEKAKLDFVLTMEIPDARVEVKRLKDMIRDLGSVNIAAIEEEAEASERYTLLMTQKTDLLNAEGTLLEIIEEMDQVMESRFEETFIEIAQAFQTVFHDLFGGGHAELKLTDPEHLLDTGIDIVAEPPGKKLQHLSLLSGGEKTLTAISLLFAILKTRPVPFCIMDEVEAALDESNVDNFGRYLMTFKDKTQFIVITHKKKTMEYADVLYGITMQESGVSKLVSVRLEDINEEK